MRIKRAIMMLKIFILWRTGLCLITYLGSFTFPKVANGGLGAIGPGREFDFWASWAQWDGGHYYQIVKDGYLTLGDYAFFPLFPLSVKFLSYFFLENAVLVGMIITNVSLLLFLIVLFKFIKERYSPNIAFSSVVTFLLFPTTFFAGAYYSESIFLLLVALTFLFLSTKKFLQAAIIISLASLTRLVGVMLIISIFYNYFAELKFKVSVIDRRFLHLFVASFGFALYSLWLFAKLNDPFGYLTVQSFWNRTVTDPISTITIDAFAFFTQGPRPLMDYFNFTLTAFFLIVLVLGVKKISSSLWIFSILVILIPASTGTLSSMPRYLLSSLGVFIIIGQFLEKRSVFKIPLWATSLVLQIFFAVRFINGYWVS